MNVTSEKDGLLRELKKLWKNGLFRSLFLVMIVVLGVFTFREVLIFSLRTSYPLTTPISGSMEPTLYRGDLLVVQGGLKANDIIAEPKPNGTIIVFRNIRNPSDIPIVHRVIDKYQVDDTWYFVTKGDNPNNPIDDWSGYKDSEGRSIPKGGVHNKGGVPEDYVFGKVIWRIPLLGNMKIFLDEFKINLDGVSIPIGWVISILLLIALLFLDNMTSSERIKKTQAAGETTKGD